MTAVRCVDLCKTYRQGDQDIKALDHLSLDIAEGDFVCLSSPSGGGKTTLLNAIGGLDKPDQGEVYISGHDAMAPDFIFRHRGPPHAFFPGFHQRVTLSSIYR